MDYEMDYEEEESEIILLLSIILIRLFILVSTVGTYFQVNNNIEHRRHRPRRLRYRFSSRVPSQISHLNRIISMSDEACRTNTRMSRNAVAKLVYLLQSIGGLQHSKNVRVEEKVTIFLSIVSHHKKNRIIGHDFMRSGETVSKYFHEVLKSIIKIHSVLLVKPTPVEEGCDNERWKHFKGCLGALDGTYVLVKVAAIDKPRYRTRKQHICVNVLGVCDQKMRFIYVLSGWEGSAADSRVLRDAVNRPNGLKVPVGCYYLCDLGYMNGEGFLTPYKKTRYHLNEWGSGALAPRTPQEYFNLKHSSARNIIERSFCLLKNKWGILRSSSYYPIQVQNHIILACALLHNFCINEYPDDPDRNIDDLVLDTGEEEHENLISLIEPSQQWSNWRDTLAAEMFNSRPRR